ncbi:hypothetical protein OWC48_18985 [Bradyrhizobium sp. Arg816]|nr:hypothetical protein [Bradyrhizobium sp. Arg816]
MQKRRRFKQTQTLEERLSAAAQSLRQRAKELAPGKEREHLLRQARQTETASHIEEWLRSPGLRPPQ